jgi:hypothetical protein
MAAFSRFKTVGRWALLLLAGAAAATAGCRQPARPKGTVSVVPTYDQATGKLQQITFDRNHDSRPDAWLFMDGTRPVRADLDENYDGAVDRWEHYRAEASMAEPGRLPRGELVKAELSTRFDGHISRWETYEGGRLSRVEEDTSGDLRPDKWETWTDGSLVEVALDTKGSGKPDRRLVYPTDGTTPQMLVDAKGDGNFQPLAAQ